MSIRKIISSRYILWNMAKKELKAKYLGSVLGIWWAVITPLLMMGAITFIFTKVIRIDIRSFPLFSLAGIMPWFFFSVSLSEATPSLIHKSQLLKQFNFPIKLIPISSVLANFINFVIGLLFIVPVFIIFKIEVITALIFLPLILFLHLLFTIGMGLGLACLNVFFRDLPHLLNILLIFWFWMTPIFYSIDMIPESYSWICNLNPMAIYIRLYQSVLFKAEIPSIGLLLSAIYISLGVFLAGYIVFVKLENYFIKRV